VLLMKWLVRLISLLPLGVGIFAFTTEVPWYLSIVLLIIGLLCVYSVWSKSSAAKKVGNILKAGEELDGDSGGSNA
jgi:F0F1-type ATP synthase assembly protein I